MRRIDVSMAVNSPITRIVETMLQFEGIQIKGFWRDSVYMLCSALVPTISELRRSRVDEPISVIG